MAETPRPWPLGAALREAREKRGLSQREAARTSGISTTTWAHLEVGERTVTADYTIPMKPRPSIVIAAARTVGCDPVEALRMAGVEHPESKVDRPDDAPDSLAGITARLERIERELGI